MSKWISETHQLPSKSQLKRFRIQRWNSLLNNADLDMRQYHFMTAVEKALEVTLWKDADSDTLDHGYEKRKEVLRGQLTALAANELVVYFQEIGVPESSVEDYLPESPV
tara:strand:- start:56 stop:382 length:327 start_codon:yes stop_codon:yes gene_type:complete